MSLRPHIPFRFERRITPGNDLHARAETPGQPVGASYVWLAYSIFFFIEPIFRHSLLYWIKCVAIYAVFLLVYTAYVWTCDRVFRLAMVAAMFALGLATLYFNSGASCFLVFVAAMLPFSFPTFRVMAPVMLGEIVTLWAMWYLLLRPRLPVDYIVGGFFVLVVGISNTFVAKGKLADLRLKQAQEENVTLAATAERERIARDLHDVLGHTLSVIVLKAELAGRIMERDPARAAAEIAEVEHTARTALAEVREAITGYRSKGLVQEIDKARLTLAAAAVRLSCDTAPPVLDAGEETAMALALREAVTNVVRHAAATTCLLRFSEDSSRACLMVEDDGRGSSRPEGNGLRGMRERVEALGGEVRVLRLPAPRSGTRVCVELPLRLRVEELRIEGEPTEQVPHEPPLVPAEVAG